MRRREFIGLLASAAATWPLAARAQNAGDVRRIGILVNATESDLEKQAELATFRAGLEKLGWTEGHNVRFEYRWTAGSFERLNVYADELIALAPDAILATNAPTLDALRKRTRTIPIIFVQVVDPVGESYVASLARPGGNVTGFTHFEHAIAGKWMQLLKDIAPRVNKVAVVWNPNNVSVNGFMRWIWVDAPSSGLEPIEVHVRNAADIETAIARLSQTPNVGLIVPPDFTTVVNRAPLIALAARHNLPAIYPFRLFADADGLISYGINLRQMYGRAASYFHRVLQGEAPGELPVQAPDRYELVVNLKAAKALGLEVPDNLIAIADDLIE